MVDKKPKDGYIDPDSGLELSAAQVLAQDPATEIDLRGDVTEVSLDDPSESTVGKVLAATGTPVTATEGLHAVTVGESDGGHVVVRQIGSEAVEAAVQIPPSK